MPRCIPLSAGCGGGLLRHKGINGMHPPRGFFRSDRQQRHHPKHAVHLQQKTMLCQWLIPHRIVLCEQAFHRRIVIQHIFLRLLFKQLKHRIRDLESALKGGPKGPDAVFFLLQLRLYNMIHKDIMAQAAAHDEQMEQFVMPEGTLPCIFRLQRIDDAAGGIHYAAGQQPEKARR